MDNSDRQRQMERHAKVCATPTAFQEVDRDSIDGAPVLSAEEEAAAVRRLLGSFVTVKPSQETAQEALRQLKLLSQSE